MLAEPIQTALRRYGVSSAYEQIKDLTLGQDGITRASLQALIKTLAIPEAGKRGLITLTLAAYIGQGFGVGKED